MLKEASHSFWISFMPIFVSLIGFQPMEVLRRFYINISLRHLTSFGAMLCLPAFLLNLDLVAFIGDEAIRTLVALEMKLSGNFIVPTMNGEEYFNKPPLYNWFIYLLSEALGYYGEWPTRLTTLIFLALFAYSVYRYCRREFDSLTAVTMAFMLLTSGRILFWDSMLGLIDICFSWIIYLNFMILYSLGKAQRWKLMFILSYLLFSIAFLLKGLPAFVFQGIAVITALRLHGVLKHRLFSINHWIGIGIGLLPLLAYYSVYASQVSLEQVFSILFDQSMQRTATHHGIWKTVVHVFTFPPEQVYHFLPWSLLVLVVFHPKFLSWIRANDFVRFNFWILLANLPVYWLSVQVYPRYLLMFIPLFNVFAYYIFQEAGQLQPIWWKIIRTVFLSLTAVTAVGCLLMPLFPQVQDLPFIVAIWIIGTLLLSGCLLGMYVDKARLFLWFALALLVVRGVFDVVVLPIRVQNHRVNICRADCLRLAEKYGHETWVLYGETFTHQVARFYTAGYTNQIIRQVDDTTDRDAVYLVDTRLYPDFSGRIIDSLILESGEVLALMRVHP